MGIPCSRCGAQLEVTLFALQRRARCACGASAELRRRGDALTWTLLYSDLPRVDVDIAIAALREWVSRHLPDRMDLFEMIWAARWERLREQGWERGTAER